MLVDEPVLIPDRKRGCWVFLLLGQIERDVCVNGDERIWLQRIRHG